MPRLMLSDERWSKLPEILLYMTIYNKRDLPMTVKGMLYRMRTGHPGGICLRRLGAGIGTKARAHTSFAASVRFTNNASPH